MAERTHYAGDGCQPAHQTPGPASPPAGPGPRVPAPARGAAAGAGDPANENDRLYDLLVQAEDEARDADGRAELAEMEIAVVTRERDEARASLAAALSAIARVRACVETWQPAAPPALEVLAALETPGGGT